MPSSKPQRHSAGSGGPRNCKGPREADGALPAWKPATRHYEPQPDNTGHYGSYSSSKARSGKGGAASAGSAIRFNPGYEVERVGNGGMGKSFKSQGSMSRGSGTKGSGGKQGGDSEGLLRIPAGGLGRLDEGDVCYDVEGRSPSDSAWRGGGGGRSGSANAAPSLSGSKGHSGGRRAGSGVGEATRKHLDVAESPLDDILSHVNSLIMEFDSMFK